ncbi:hypothetical protein AB0M27_42645, partial [Streptomyces sp. NPDC052107]
MVQQRALELLTAAADSADATPRQLAYLTDRCQVNHSLPQTFGTQYTTGPDVEGSPPWRTPLLISHFEGWVRRRDKWVVRVRSGRWP